MVGVGAVQRWEREHWGRAKGWGSGGGGRDRSDCAHGRGHSVEANRRGRNTCLVAVDSEVTYHEAGFALEIDWDHVSRR